MTVWFDMLLLLRGVDVSERSDTQDRLTRACRSDRDTAQAASRSIEISQVQARAQKEGLLKSPGNQSS